MSKTVDLGPVSAYALAVKHGYEGTEEQWIAEVESKRVDAVNAAADARKSADTAAEKAEIATQKAEEIKGESEAAAASATKAQSYAVGGTGSRDGEDTDNAQYYYEQVKRVSQGLNGIIPMGTVEFADLPVSGMENGWMYNISDDFTSDDRFNDGGGIFYGKGNNVIWTSEGKWDVTAGSGVTGIKGNKEKTYRQGNVNLTPEQIGAVAEDGDASDTTVAFASSDTPDVDASAWESVAKLTSGEKHASIFAKVSQMFKNVRYLYKMLGTTDISGIGGGTVTGAIVSQNIILGTKGGSIGYASDCSLESAVNQFISDMAPYVPYLIHGDNIGGIPISTTQNDVTIEVIVLNKLTNAYRIVLYNNKGTDIHTICRIDGGWKSWVQIA